MKIELQYFRWETGLLGTGKKLKFLKNYFTRQWPRMFEPGQISVECNSIKFMSKMNLPYLRNVLYIEICQFLHPEYPSRSV